MRIRQRSKDIWYLEVPMKDREQFQYIVEKFRQKTPRPPYGKWRRMTSEKLWENLVIQFCVFGGARPIANLIKDTERYNEFVEEISLDRLTGAQSARGRRQDFIASHLKAFKATRFHNRAARRINNCVENQNIVKDGKVTLLDNLNDDITEEEMRNVLLERIPYFKMKSVSDFMIEIGAAKNLMAFDTRVVGLLNMQFGLNVCIYDIQSNMDLYKTLEKELRKVCENLGIELSYLDRILFQHSDEIEELFVGA